MKFIVKHEINGRLRIHVVQKRMTYTEADTLSWFLSNQKNVTDVKVYERTADAVICYKGEREEILTVLKQFSYEGLYRLIEGRKTSPKEGSYTTYLFEKGLDKILKKVGEECTEVIIGGRKEDKEETIYEIADLTYHVMVLMIELGISVEDITKELEKRHVIDHKVKQERMQ